tara:strand:- start:90 stop:374 length:285 start_codon:yes stop_codon:yes gene_type:complete
LEQLFVFLSEIEIIRNVVSESINTARDKIGGANIFVVVVIVRLDGKRYGNCKKHGKQQEIFIPNKEIYNLLHCFVGLINSAFYCEQRHKWATIF